MTGAQSMFPKEMLRGTSAELSLGYPDQGPMEGVPVHGMPGFGKHPLLSEPAGRSENGGWCRRGGPTPDPDEELAPVGLVHSQILGSFAAETHLPVWVDTGFSAGPARFQHSEASVAEAPRQARRGHGTPPCVCKPSVAGAGLPGSGPERDTRCALRSLGGRLCFWELRGASSIKSHGWC